MVEYETNTYEETLEFEKTGMKAKVLVFNLNKPREAKLILEGKAEKDPWVRYLVVYVNNKQIYKRTVAKSFKVTLDLTNKLKDGENRIGIVVSTWVGKWIVNTKLIVEEEKTSKNIFQAFWDWLSSFFKW